jgi:proline iminopeptidase
MLARFFVTGLAASLALTPLRNGTDAQQARPDPVAHSSRIPVGKGSLYARDIGSGPPMIVLHGGPDFDQAYLLPDFDRLADVFHIIYYDQRGRGKSAEGVEPTDVSLASDVDDVDRVREHFHLESATVLGHSFGAVLALEYALRYPSRVSRLVLLNPAPASQADYAMLRRAYTAQLGPDFDKQRGIIAGDAYKAADPETVAARYRIHFEHAFAKPEEYERLMTRMRAAFISQGKDGILKARAVEDRLYADSWLLEGYDLLPRLHSLSIPTLVVYGKRDFIPGEIAQHIAAAIPNARLVALDDCGHFSYMECPLGVRDALTAFAVHR